MPQASGDELEAAALVAAELAAHLRSTATRARLRLSASSTESIDAAIDRFIALLERGQRR